MPFRKKKSFYSPSTKRRSMRKKSGKKSRSIRKSTSGRSIKKSLRSRGRSRTRLQRSKSPGIKHRLQYNKHFIDFKRFFDDDMPYKSNSVYVLDLTKMLNTYKGTQETIYHDIVGVYTREQYVDDEIINLTLDKPSDEKLIFNVYKVAIAFSILLEVSAFPISSIISNK